MQLRVRVASINVNGTPEIIGERHRKPIVSAIRKRPVTGPVLIGPEGLTGDTQVDREHHGGERKAVYAMMAHTVDWYASRLGLTREPTAGVLLGENLTLSGDPSINEETVRIGDIFKCGRLRFQVSTARQPCATLQALHADKVVNGKKANMAKLMIDSGKCGWYFTVLAEGELAPGDVLELIERIPGEPTVQELFMQKIRQNKNLPAH